MTTGRIGAHMALLAMLVACGNTASGVKKDTERAADNTAAAATAATQSVGGALETASVKSAIMADRRVDASDINIDTDEARKTVTLNGFVKTADQKRVAGEIAASKAVGYAIKNNLGVRR